MHQGLMAWVAATVETGRDEAVERGNVETLVRPPYVTRGSCGGLSANLIFRLYTEK